MFYIVEHDMKVHNIIDTKGKANKYGKAKLFDTEGDALYWLSKYKINGGIYVNGAIFGMTATQPFYEVKEATPEQLERWR